MEVEPLVIHLDEVAQRLLQQETPCTKAQVGVFNTAQVNVRLMHNTCADWHVHADTDEMFVVLAGTITVDTPTKSFPLTQQDCLIIKAGTRHRARTTESATLMTLICPGEV